MSVVRRLVRACAASSRTIRGWRPSYFPWESAWSRCIRCSPRSATAAPLALRNPMRLRLVGAYLTVWLGLAMTVGEPAFPSVAESARRVWPDAPRNCPAVYVSSDATGECRSAGTVTHGSSGADLTNGGPDVSVPVPVLTGQCRPPLRFPRGTHVYSLWKLAMLSSPPVPGASRQLPTGERRATTMGGALRTT